MSGESTITRRAVLGGGALVLAFSMAPGALLLAEESEKLPGNLGQAPFLDAWIRILSNGGVTVFTGKAELGQGIKTALAQIVADELSVPIDLIDIVEADTERTPNEGYTAGSHSMQDSGTALMHAAAQVRAILIATAATKWSLKPEWLRADSGFVVSEDGRRISYGELVDAETLHTPAKSSSPLQEADRLRLMGKPVPRIDIPAKLTGGAAYVQDLRLPGMVHARVVRPPSYGAKLQSLPENATEGLKGFVKIVRDGSFVAVVTEREYQAVLALRQFEQRAVWEETAKLPEAEKLYSTLSSQVSQTSTILDRQSKRAKAAHELSATYRRAYQMHASVGPSCAVALFDNGKLTVWSHAQGMFPLRSALADLLSMPETDVHCIHVEGSGCYGHNGADDVAADAALIAHALPGRPVRVQWMREQEHQWEPYGPAMTTSVRGAVATDGSIVSWQYSVTSNTHATRPGPGGALLASWYLENPRSPPAPRPLPGPEGGGDRNAIPLYDLPNARVEHRFVAAMPIRVSALRSLGAYMNIFSIESFMDELAAAAASDPVAFRLRHLSDARARDVIAVAADRFGWSRYARAERRGRGFAFARYKNLAAYCAVAVEVEVMPESGEIELLRAVSAVDSGFAVNPDGVRNQIEGGILQAASWTLYEAVAFDRQRITSRDWSSYPILRFSAVPRSVEVHVMDRPGEPFLGTGEAAQGPTAAAIANAVADATGVRMRDIPLRRVSEAGRRSR